MADPLSFQVVVDAADPHALARFWAAALHYELETNDEMVRGLLAQGLVTEDEVVEIDGIAHFRVGCAIVPPGVAREAVLAENRRILFMAVPEPKTVKNRVHLDLHVAGPTRTEQADARLAEEVARIEALGATVLYRHDAPDGRWVTLADPEGNELCLH